MTKERFKGVKIAGLTFDEVDSVKKMVQAEIDKNDLEYKIQGPFFERSERVETPVALQVEIKEEIIMDETYYYISAGDCNLLDTGYDEYPYKSTVEGAVLTAKALHGKALDMVNGIFQGVSVSGNEEIDGTGRFILTYTGGDSEIFDPGYCGSNYD